MTISADLAVLVLYLAQQLGVVLGFGAQTILLLTFLLGKRDGVINETEDAIAHGVYRVLVFALCITVVSAAVMTFMFLSSGDSVLSQPAFFMKWLLVILSCVFAWGIKGSRLWNNFWEGVSGANWGALFLIHIFAPVAAYIVLAKIYGVLMVGGLVAWYLLLFAMRGHNALAAVEEIVKKRAQKKLEEKPVAKVLPTVVPKPMPVFAAVAKTEPKKEPILAPAFARPSQWDLPVKLTPEVPTMPKGVIEVVMPTVPPMPVPLLAKQVSTPPVVLQKDTALTTMVQTETLLPATTQDKPKEESLNDLMQDPKPLANLPGFHVMPRTLDELKELEERRRHPITA